MFLIVPNNLVIPLEDIDLDGKISPSTNHSIVSDTVAIEAIGDIILGYPTRTATHAGFNDSRFTIPAIQATQALIPEIEYQDSQPENWPSINSI